MTEKVEVRRGLTLSLAIGRADQGKKKKKKNHTSNGPIQDKTSNVIPVLPSHSFYASFRLSLYLCLCNILESPLLVD